MKLSNLLANIEYTVINDGNTDFPVFGLMIEPLFHSSCRWKSVHVSVSLGPDIPLLAYQQSILLSLSQSAQVYVEHRHIE